MQGRTPVSEIATDLGDERRISGRIELHLTKPELGSQSAIESQKVIKFSKDCVAGSGRSRGNVNFHWTLLPE